MAARSKMRSQTKHDQTPTSRPQRRSKQKRGISSPQGLTLAEEGNAWRASFYNLLDRTIHIVPAHDKLVVLRDFNSRVGSDHCLWNGILGHHGTGKCSANGQLPLILCAEHELVITNSLFRLPIRQMTTWKYPRSKHWHILDYVLTRTKNSRNVRIARSMPGADGC
uniref:Endonuclease/exonuclease/phosphatase domain-containing protein n=1 Tax=Octopus bimaculoides TaxID=37653 RepID=A0A0L8I8A6_OCTBM